MRNTKTGLKPYPAYKKLEIPWLEKVPTHWTVAEAKNFYEIQMGKMLQPQPAKPTDVEVPYLKAMNVQWYSVQTDNAQTMWASPEEIEQLQVIPGDLLVCEGGEGGRAGIVQAIPNGFIIQNALHRVRPKRTGRNELLQHLMKVISETGWFDAINNKATIAHFTKEKFASLPIPVPPLDEQAAIVRYLDDADQRIRAYVSAKERLIVLLEEERQAVIHQAVTRGLDPNVKLKPSGVEWLGDVPEHWEIQQLKQKSRIFRGRFSHRPRNDASLYDGPYPFIQTGDIARAGKWITTYEQTLNDRGLAVSQMFPKGTLVMTIAANIGDAAILDLDACFPDSVVGFTPSHNVDRDYLYNLFQSMKTEFLRVAPVNTQGNLNVDRIGATIVAFPPLAEQTAIAAHLNQLAYGSDTAIDRARRQIELMEEYRTRLIADVVTGKIDITRI